MHAVTYNMHIIWEIKVHMSVMISFLTMCNSAWNGTFSTSSSVTSEIHSYRAENHSACYDNVHGDMQSFVLYQCPV